MVVRLVFAAISQGVWHKRGLLQGPFGLPSNGHHCMISKNFLMVVKTLIIKKSCAPREVERRHGPKEGSACILGGPKRPVSSAHYLAEKQTFLLSLWKIQGHWVEVVVRAFYCLVLQWYWHHQAVLEHQLNEDTFSKPKCCIERPIWSKAKCLTCW